MTYAPEVLSFMECVG